MGQNADIWSGGLIWGRSVEHSRNLVFKLLPFSQCSLKQRNDDDNDDNDDNDDDEFVQQFATGSNWTNTFGLV